ncbi:hypothetical protein D3C72_1027680 [compost metagenome]
MQHAALKRIGLGPIGRHERPVQPVGCRHAAHRDRQRQAEPALPVAVAGFVKAGVDGQAHRGTAPGPHQAVQAQAGLRAVAGREAEARGGLPAARMARIQVERAQPGLHAGLAQESARAEAHLDVAEHGAVEATQPRLKALLLAGGPGGRGGAQIRRELLGEAHVVLGRGAQAAGGLHLTRHPVAVLAGRGERVADVEAVDFLAPLALRSVEHQPEVVEPDEQRHVGEGVEAVGAAGGVPEQHLASV